MAVSSTRSLAARVEPKSAHVSDPLVLPFLQPDFDPADYLNTTLPSLSVTATTARGRNVPLSDLSSQLQTLLAQLNAQTSRLSNTLTQLTDEIIRSGSRLAYEVEVLRGETLSLTDALENSSKQDVELLAPAKPAGERREDAAANEIAQGEVATGDQTIVAGSDAGEPEFLQQLRTLTTVRERLDSVIKTFGSAMQWPLAPSEISVASSFISVSAPEGKDKSREDMGRQVAEKLRGEVASLLASGEDGVEAATLRVEELRSLAEVWKGTAEEKARIKLVDSLQKSVDDKQKAIGRATTDSGRRDTAATSRGHDHRYGNMDPPKATVEGGPGYGFLQNLRNLKNEMYSE